MSKNPPKPKAKPDPLAVLHGNASPPFDLAAERAIVGGMLRDPKAIDEVRLILKAAHLYHFLTRTVFEAICTQADRTGNESVDLVTVSRLLSDAGIIEDIGGYAALGDLLKESPHIVNIGYHAKIVQRLAEQRSALEAAEWMLSEAMQPSNPDTFLDDIEKKTLAIRDGRQTSTLTPLGIALHEVMARCEAVAEGHHIGLTTGIPGLDNIVSLKPQDLVVVAARTSVGKSIVGGQVALHNALLGKSVFFASVEMPRQEIAARLLSAYGNLDSSMTGARRKAYDHEVDPLTNASNALYKLKFQIDDSLAQSVSIISANARRIKRQHGLDLIVVDYLQLLQVDRQRGQSRAEVLGDISRGLKRLARELECPVLALAQLNRAAEDTSEPELHHIRESGDLEQDADQVWLLWRGDEASSLVNLKVAKHRGGPCGKITVHHDKQYMRFSEHKSLYIGTRMQP